MDDFDDLLAGLDALDDFDADGLGFDAIDEVVRCSLLAVHRRGFHFRVRGAPAGSH